jgi:exo-1,4-beta-D-glucosaminidase
MQILRLTEPRLGARFPDVPFLQPRQMFMCSFNSDFGRALACSAILAITPIAWSAPAVLSFAPVDAEPLETVPPGALVLHDGWQLQSSAIISDSGAELSQPARPAGDWYSATVPMTVLGVLVRHGIYPDPYVGTNNMRIPDASDAHNRRYALAQFSHLPDKSNPWTKPWWLRREFTVPETYRGKSVWLHLDGINYRAAVWLNGQQIAKAEDTVGMFRRFRFEIGRMVRPGATNVLAIRIHQLDYPGDPIYEQLDGLNGSFGPNGGDGEILRNVTQYCTIGWDWVSAARDRNMGLWQHVWLEATGPVAVRDPAAFTAVTLPEGTRAAATLRLHLDNSAASEELVELSARIAPDGFAGEAVEVRTNIMVRADGQSEVVLKPEDHPALMLRNPRLWWPASYGEQPLYSLTVQASVNSHISSVATSHFGVRQVGSYVLPSGGRAFTVNGRTLRLTGGAWVPDFLLSWSSQRYRDEVRLMAAGNHSVVRINGCGIMPPDVFFEECDRRGLMVWEDFSRTSMEGNYRKDGRTGWNPADCDPRVFLANMTDTILRLRGHPSLLVWCGCNEADLQQNCGQPLQNDILPALDGTRPWLTSSQTDPPWANEPNHFWTGGPWHMVRLPQYFQLYATDPAFVARDEIGLASPPPINSVVKALPDWGQPDARWFPLNVSMGFHDATSLYEKSDRIYREDVGQPACLAEYLWIADLYNNRAYRAIFEAANKVRPRNAGTHLWKVNAAWPSFMWQVYDWYLRPNAGYYSMKSACQPLHLQHSEDDQAVQVISTLPEAQPNLRVRITLLAMDGTVEFTREQSVDVPANASVSVGRLPELIQDGRLHFLALDLLDQHGRAMDRQVKWVQLDCKWRDLLKLPPARVEARVQQHHEEGPETVYRVVVTNLSSIPAVQVWVEVLRGTQGEEILPSFWNDNALTLLPHERRDLTVRFRTALLAGAAPHLMMEGWNVMPREARMSNGRATSLGLKVTDCRVDPADLRLHFNAARTDTRGSRWTTWPLPLLVDGQLIRYVRVAASSEAAVSASLALENLSPGEHRLSVAEGAQTAFVVSPAVLQAQPAK